MVLSAIASGAALFWLKPVLLPLALATVIHLSLTPIMDRLITLLRCPRLVAVGVVWTLAAGMVPLAFGIGAVAVQSLTVKVQLYQDSLWRLLARVGHIFPLPTNILEADSLREVLAELPLSDILVGTTNALLELTSNVVLVMIFLLFLLIGHRPGRTRPGTLRQVLKSRVRRYLLTKVAVSAATGVLVAIVLAVLRMDLWLVFGMAAFGLNFIPSIGSIFATFLPLPMALVNPNFSGTDVALVMLVPGSIQFTIGNVIEPKLMGDSLDLHPVTVLVALIFWGSLWGVVGMLLAAPATAVMKIVLEELEITAPLARIMAGDFGGPPPAPTIDP